MTPSALFDNPRSDLTQTILSDALQQHLATGTSLDEILGLRSVGYSAMSPRLSYLRQRRGALLVVCWKLLQEDGLNPREAANLTYDYITSRKRPPGHLESLITELIELGSMANVKLSSRVAFRAKIKAIGGQVKALNPT